MKYKYSARRDNFQIASGTDPVNVLYSIGCSRDLIQTYASALRSGGTVQVMTDRGMAVVIPLPDERANRPKKDLSNLPPVPRKDNGKIDWENVSDDQAELMVGKFAVLFFAGLFAIYIFRLIFGA